MDKEKKENRTMSIALTIASIIVALLIISELYIVYVSKTNNNFLNINSLSHFENNVENELSNTIK